MTELWKRVTIDDLGRVVTGRTPSSKNPEHFGSEYPFITPTDMGSDSRHIQTGRFVSESGKETLIRILLPKDSICFVCIGATIGKICMTSRPSVTNQQINSVIVDASKHDPQFVFYVLSQMGEIAKSHAGGAATPIINKGKFEKLELSVPNLPTQRKIAGILSAYDDLIENNLRRIKILEEMAQSLYREWFVHFRFPGHESTPMVDSSLGPIPEGWKVKGLGEIASVKWGDTSTTKKSYTKEGFRAYSAAGQDGLLDHFDHERIGIVLSAIGANCGRTWLATGKWSCIKNTICLWSTEPNISTEFLYLATFGQEFWPKRGAAQPFISQGDSRKLKILVPERILAEQATKLFGSSFELKETLSRRNETLRQTRDLLLPKLLSGPAN